MNLSTITDPKLRQRIERADREQNGQTITDGTQARAAVHNSHLRKVDCKPHASKLNKTERRYLDRLWVNGHDNVWQQAIRLKLAERCYYTPDLASVVLGVLTFWEVKGAFERDDAIVKLKTAARLYPQFDFVKAQWKNGRWNETDIPK